MASIGSIAKLLDETLDASKHKKGAFSGSPPLPKRLPRQPAFFFVCTVKEGIWPPWKIEKADARPTRQPRML
jgi:hypothetical protein